MCDLKKFKDLPIDWEMTPEDAITRHLEWGNNSYKSGRMPVNYEGEASYYFVVNTWDAPRVILVKMTSEGPEELAELSLPEDLAQDFYENVTSLKGVYPVTPKIKTWLEDKMGL
jgi:hypothetical protein